MALHASSKISLSLYEDLYAVSDLHFGGTGGTRLFRQGSELAALIRYLAADVPSGGGVRALVLNGDIFDTLAEEPKYYVARPQEAEGLLQRIMDHADFAPVFDALKTFVSKERHRLVFNIGNHDLELIYPNVQEQIVRRLGGADAAAIRGRILFSTTGIGHLCRVGNAERSARVFCFHGNEYDTWNAISPVTMARLARSACLGAPSKIADDPPNAGTRLVIDVMNSIKKKYPFVDMLKPETDTVFNVLLVLDPKIIEALPGVVQIAATAGTQGKARVKQVLGGPGDTAEATAATAEWQPGENFRAFLGRPATDSNMLETAWQLSASDEPVVPVAPGEVLGMMDFVKNTYHYLVNRISKNEAEALRCAFLDWIGDDQEWSSSGPDGICDTLSKMTPDVDAVIAGHTHLRRQKSGKNFFYLNTGTWGRLMHFDKALLEDPNRWTALWHTLKTGTMEDLDSLTENVLNQGTVGVIRLKTDGTAVEGALCEKKANVDAPQPVNGAVWQEVNSDV